MTSVPRDETIRRDRPIVSHGVVLWASQRSDGAVLDGAGHLAIWARLHEATDAGAPT
jgi:hypothetical protein